MGKRKKAPSPPLQSGDDGIAPYESPEGADPASESPAPGPGSDPGHISSNAQPLMTDWRNSGGAGGAYSDSGPAGPAAGNEGTGDRAARTARGGMGLSDMWGAPAEAIGSTQNPGTPLHRDLVPGKVINPGTRPPVAPRKERRRAMNDEEKAYRDLVKSLGAATARIASEAAVTPLPAAPLAKAILAHNHPAPAAGPGVRIEQKPPVPSAGGMPQGTPETLHQHGDPRSTLVMRNPGASVTVTKLDLRSAAGMMANLHHPVMPSAAAEAQRPEVNTPTGAVSAARNAWHTRPAPGER